MTDTMYQHVYQALRNSMVDRDRDDISVIDTAEIVTIPQGAYAMKAETPSTAYLIAYSILYYQDFLNTGTHTNPPTLIATALDGGKTNPFFPFLFNEHIRNIALAVGVHTGLFNVARHPLVDRPVIIANMNNPLVRKTKELIEEQGLTYKYSKEVLVDLLQQEEYVYQVRLADDFIANAKFIEDNFVSVDGAGETANG